MKKFVFSIAMMSIALMSCNKDDENLVESMNISENSSETQKSSINKVNSTQALPGMYSFEFEYGIWMRTYEDGFPVGSECNPGSGICSITVSAGPVAGLEPAFGTGSQGDASFYFYKGSLSTDDYNDHFQSGTVEIHSEVIIPADVIDDLELPTDFVVEAGDYDILEYTEDGEEIIEVVIL